MKDKKTKSEQRKELEHILTIDIKAFALYCLKHEFHSKKITLLLQLKQAQDIERVADALESKKDKEK